MNESVELTLNSFTLMGLTFRAFSIVVSDCVPPLVVLFHAARPTRSPLKAADPEVTLKVALTVAPGATGPAIAAGVLVTAVHCLGAEMLKLTSVTGSPVVFLKVTVVSCEDPGENVWSPGGVSIADAGARLNRCTSYLAAATLEIGRAHV